MQEWASYAIKFISVEAPSCQAVCFILKKCLTPFDAHSIIAKSSSHSIMNARSILWAFFFASFSPSIAYAIPNQHLNPHPDDPGKISWQQKPGNPDDINHLHIEGVKISILPESGTNHDKTWGFTHGHLEKSPTNSKSYTRRGQDPFAGSESTSESAWTMLII